MKKLFTILTASLALVVFANSANAQSAATTSETKAASVGEAKPATTDLKSAQPQKEVKASAVTATKAATTTEQKQESLNKQIADYERKIEANRNNPNFDLKGAEAELARLKEGAGVK